MTTKETIENLKGKSLIDNNPELCTEWNYEKNGKLLPEMVTKGSGLKVWWKCSKGHEWQVSVYDRVMGRGCPCCSGHSVVVGENDLLTLRPDLCKEWNYVKNKNMTPNNIKAGSNKKVWWNCEKGHEWQARPSYRARGQGCPICANKRVLQGYNDLATTNPNLMKEWNYEKNGNLTPQMVSKGSGKKVWWKGNCGHEWQASVNKRAYGTGCPYCSRRKKIENATK